MYLVGSKMMFEGDNGLMASFDGRHKVEVRSPMAYHSKLQGICGNMNDQKDDDYLTKTGEKVTDLNKLGDSWVVAGGVEGEGYVISRVHRLLLNT